MKESKIVKVIKTVISDLKRNNHDGYLVSEYNCRVVRCEHGCHDCHQDWIWLGDQIIK